MLRKKKKKEEVLTSSSFWFLVLQKSLRQKRVGKSCLIRIQERNEIFSKQIQARISKHSSASLAQALAASGSLMLSY